MKTSELTGAALDWAVAKCEGKAQGHPPLGERRDLAEGITPYGVKAAMHYSTNWAQGGPIIEREGLTIGKVTNSPNEWSAESFQDDGVRVKYLRYGPTPLIAAMRCYVASKLGDEVEIPGELK